MFCYLKQYAISLHYKYTIKYKINKIYETEKIFQPRYGGSQEVLGYRPYNGKTETPLKNHGVL